MGRTIDGGARPRARAERSAAIAIPSTCWAKRRAPTPTPSAIDRAYRARHRRHRPGRGRARARSTGPASRSSCRRCIRAMSSPSAQRVMDELVPRARGARRSSPSDRHRLHHRRRGGRPARPLARCHRGGARREPRWPAGTASAWRCRPIRSARLPLIDWLADMARRHGRRLMVRLVKGAYWDSEIKRARSAGWPAIRSSPARPRPTSPTRLRQAAAGATPTRSIRSSPPTTPIPLAADAGDGRADRPRFEFQRLHGMGEALYEHVVAADATGYRLPRLCAGRQPRGPAALSGAPPAGERRQHLLRQPPRRREAAGRGDRRRSRRAACAACRRKPHPRIPLPADLYGAERQQFQRHRPDRSSTRWCRWPQAMQRARPNLACRAADRRRGRGRNGARTCCDPADRRRRDRRGGRGRCRLRSTQALSPRRARPSRPGTPAAPSRAPMPGARRRSAGGRIAQPLMAIGVREAGKTLPDALAEVREAVDFCRYYAGRARAPISRGRWTLPGPTGETQPARAARPRRLRLHQPVEFPAGDLHRPGRRGAGRRQRRHRQARRADAADRRARRCDCCIAPACRAMCCTCCRATAPTVGAGAGRRSAHRRRRLHRLDRDRPGDQPRARRTQRPDRAAHRRDRRAERHVRRYHRAAANRWCATC